MAPCKKETARASQRPRELKLPARGRNRGGRTSRILERPENEKPFLLIPVGYPTEDCRIPVLARKPLDEILVRVESSST